MNIRHPISIQESTIPEAGQGVFLKNLAREGELLWEDIGLLIPNTVAFNNILEDYVYDEGYDHHQVLVLGPGSFLNHNRWAANVRWVEEEGEERTFKCKMKYYASRDIAAGEELFIDYGEDWEEG